MLADSDAVVKVESELVFVVLHQFADHFVVEFDFPVFQSRRPHGQAPLAGRRFSGLPLPLFFCPSAFCNVCTLMAVE